MFPVKAQTYVVLQLSWYQAYIFVNCVDSHTALDLFLVQFLDQGSFFSERHVTHDSAKIYGSVDLYLTSLS